MITKDGAFQEMAKVRRWNKIVEIQMGKIPQNPNLKFKKQQGFDQAQKYRYLAMVTWS